MRVYIQGQETAELSSDQIAEVEVTPQNDGEIDAVGVVLRVSAPGVIFQQSEISIGALPAHEKGLSHRIQFSIPRAFSKDTLPVVVELPQKDFPAKSVSREFAVRRRLPDLRARWRVLDSADSYAIEQNQTAILELQLDNNGNLPALAVVARLNINNPQVSPSGPIEATLGTIEPKSSARAHFVLRVTRSVPVGQLPVGASISQADFPALNEAASIEVRAVQTREVHIVPSPAIRPLPAHSTPPTVVWVPMSVFTVA